MTEVAPLALLAGGLATRLGHVTASTPKAMVDVLGRPFIAHQLELLRSRGVRRVVVCCGHLANQIRDYVGDGSAFDVEVKWSDDGERPLGTAGAIRRALELLGDHFFVLYGDSYLQCDYRVIQQRFERERKMGLMTLFRNEDRWEASNVQFVGGRIVDYNKRHPGPLMEYVDYGLSVFSKEAFAAVPLDSLVDLESVHRTLLEKGQLAGCEVPERFYEIGSQAGLAEFRDLMADRAQS